MRQSAPVNSSGRGAVAVSLLLLLLLLSACNRQQAGLDTYHEALALMEQGDAPSALEKLQQAARLARTDSLRALVCSQMGTLYFSQRLLDRSLESYRQAYAIDLHARDTAGLIYDLRDLGNVFRATDDRQDSCMAYFTDARRLAIATGNVAMQRDVESQMAAYYLYNDRLDEARALLFPALQHLDASNQSGLLFMMADYYHRRQERDSAAFYYRQLLVRGNLYGRQAAHRALAEYSLADGQNDVAAEHLQQYEQLTDSVHRLNDAEAVRRTAALYDYTRHEQQAQRLKVRLTLVVGSLLLVALALVAVLLYFSRRRMHYRLKVERLEQLLQRYRQRQEEERHQSAEASTVPPVAGSLKSTAIAQQIDRFLSDARQQAMGDDDFHQLEDAVEACHPAFLSRLQEFCRLTPQERRVCLLLKLGITPAGIAQLTAHSKQSITNTRSRLYKKAFGRQGTPAQWDEFVMSL
ncbi:MAG: hypothetical protein IJV24_03955 [Prevotella sp.]|nr:hypothetical protein [Prevotella sp.]